MLNLPSHAVSMRIGDELRLGAAAAADDPGPSGPSSIALLWHERTVVAIAPDQYLVTVPFGGGPVPDGIDPSLTAALRARWVTDPSRGHLAWSTSLVVAAFQATGPRAGVLTLAITAAAARPGTRLDDLRFVRELREAIEHCRSRPPGSEVGRRRRPALGER